MSSVLIDSDNSLRGFQQLVVDAVELAGSISPLVKSQLVSLLGATFPSEVLPTIGLQEASLRAVLRMLEYAKHEADRVSALRNARQPLDLCVAVLVDHASYSQVGLSRKYH